MRELRVDRTGSLLRAAVVEDGRLTDLLIERLDRPSRLGAVHLGRVGRLLPDLDAAFVRLADGTDGFLAARDTAAKSGIARALSSGSPVIVQIKAEAAAGKAATLTAAPGLAGRYLIHLPFGSGVQLSKRLPDAERAALRDAIAAQGLPGGWIVRSAAMTAAADAVAAEARVLAGQGSGLRADGLVPRLLLPAPDAAHRAWYEWGGRLDRILAAPEAWDSLRALGGERWDGPGALFDRDDLEGAIAALRQPRVALGGEASLIIEATAALVAVDVNGGATGRALPTNLAAAEEVGRQLRLRNLAGTIMVDFIEMPGRGDRDRVQQVLRRAVAEDPAGVDVHGWTRLGLLELSRRRRGPSLDEVMGEEG